MANNLKMIFLLFHKHIVNFDYTLHIQIIAIYFYVYYMEMYVYKGCVSFEINTEGGEDRPSSRMFSVDKINWPF